MATYPHWQVRISRPWYDISGSMIKLADKSETAVCFEHPPDDEVSRRHCHCYFMNINLKYDAMNERLKKLFPDISGNRDFAISGTAGKRKGPIDLSGAYIYGTTEAFHAPKWLKNISMSTVEELQESARRFYAKRGDTAQASSIKAVAKQKKLTRYEQVREIAARCLTPEFLKMGESQRIKIVREEVKSYLRSNGIFCGVIKTSEYIECVLLDLEDESFNTALNRRLNFIFYGQS